MIIDYKYHGQSGVIHGLNQSQLTFATNQLRETTYFKGELSQPLLLRDALSALYQVVISDLKYRPRDRFAFRAWLTAQDDQFLQGLALKSEAVRLAIETKQLQLDELNHLKKEIMSPFFSAQKHYFEYAYQQQYELEYVLDPVVTVHPDEISFEVFSKDESSYARVAINLEGLEHVTGLECGTTNIDFSAGLHRQFSKMRSYRKSELNIDAHGLAITHRSEGIYREKQIKLPESWLNGFLQVQSIMTLGLTKIRLMPIDAFNIIRLISRFKAKTSPRALRWEFVPERPTTVVFEPWEKRLTLSPSTLYHGDKPMQIRTWGRDRLKVLANILPKTKQVDVYLAGHGLPSFWRCDLGAVSFLLGLSGWSEQDWTSGARFELLSRRVDVSADDLTMVYNKLLLTRFGRAQEIAIECGLTVEKTRSALSFLCQSGSAMYDLNSHYYRHRDLFLAPFNALKAITRAADLEQSDNPKAKLANTLFKSGQARFTARRPVKTGYKLTGNVRHTNGTRVRPLLHVNEQGQIIEATCTCAYFKKYRLTKGPCEHILALRLAHMTKLDEEKR